MNIVHIVTIRSPDKALCGNNSPYSHCVYVQTYTMSPNMFDHYLASTYEWCPDCLKHPEVVMTTLNRTNV